MSLSLRLLAISATLAFAGAAFAATPASTTPPAAKPHTAQQQRMVDCNKQATGKKGDERKAFMSSCLKGQSTAAAAAPAAAAPAATPAAHETQQEKMKSCNADAKTKALKGADRKAFMSSCLKGAPATP
ncbi:phosphate starvation-inducible protein PsiF [Rhodanobacter denitrificans]|uniref:Phosphate starvation-inducible protein PsiF n=1 Tax=Rhodanobacter denitrificans TaxID=666685 RepID=A0A368KGV5_9GAMM|nr:PsiF family protein [Rhodanobacter denitrificans]RCS31140.1 phosphate starvation-inducible protein PsiF [Rhodanobacter denitrificans]